MAPRMLSDWEPKLLRFISRSPRRSDVIQPYLLWRFSRKEDRKAAEFLDRLLSLRPDDPAGLWFKGLVQLRTPNQAPAARKTLNRALDLGAGRLLDPKARFYRWLGRKRPHHLD